MVMIFWKYPKFPKWNQILLMFKGRVQQLNFEIFEIFFLHYWLSTYKRPPNPPRNSFWVIPEPRYSRLNVPFLAKISEIWFWPQNTTFFRVFFAHKTLLEALMVMIFWKFPKGPKWNQILLMFKVLFRFYLKLFTFKSRVWRRFSSWSPNTTFFRGFLHIKHYWRLCWSWSFGNFPKVLNETKYY